MTANCWRFGAYTLWPIFGWGRGGAYFLVGNGGIIFISPGNINLKEVLRVNLSGKHYLKKLITSNDAELVN